VLTTGRKQTLEYWVANWVPPSPTHYEGFFSFLFLFSEITIFRQNYAVACNQKESTTPKLVFYFPL
jgi:hypothetical protein